MYLLLQSSNSPIFNQLTAGISDTKKMVLIK
jgi:hypothetical protein